MWKELFHLTNEQAVVFLKDKIDEHIKKMKVIKAKKIATRMLREIGIESNYFVDQKVYYSLVRCIAVELNRRENIKKIGPSKYAIKDDIDYAKNIKK